MRASMVIHRQLGCACEPSCSHIGSAASYRALGTRIELICELCVAIRRCERAMPRRAIGIVAQAGCERQMHCPTFVRRSAVGDCGPHQWVTEPKGLAVHAEQPGGDRVVERG